IKLDSLLSITDKYYKDAEVAFVKISDYNKVLKLKGKKEINLNKNEILVMSNKNDLVKQVNEKLKSSKKFDIKGKEYLVKNDKIIDENLATYLFADNIFTIVISDEFLYDYNKIAYSILNVMYSDKNREENNKKYKEINKNFLDGKYKSLNISYMGAFSKDDIYSGSKGRTTTILFVGIYLGLVFLITSMAVLALQQLSEASDSIERYKALKRIGANSKMIDKTIFLQTLIYFALPMILALIHSLFSLLLLKLNHN
ncbi:MAG: FtsX-like permease family protein, partial [Staphylococcus aureus]|nr:FtsX-like permease family protein [Staphylococcus aureus]